MDIKKTTAGIGTALALLGGGTYTADQIANPYIDKGATLEVRSESTIPEAGEVSVELTKDRPEVRLKKFSGEVDMGVSYDGVVAQGSRAFLTNRMEWKDGAKEVHAYPIEATAQMEDGGFEMEVVLNEAPTTNVFNFNVDGWESLDFFYQPELTLEEIVDGAERPENVIGSYAVYYKNHTNHVEGQTNYATGKAFHIFRPKAVDAKGNEVWAELSYNDGMLSVIVPSDFLDGASYPVHVDPTFGYTTIGASNQSDYNPAGSPFSAPESGSVSSITSYHSISAATTKEFGAAIYSDVLNLPSSLLAEDTGNVTKSTASGAWLTNSISYSTTGGTTYWLATWCNNVSGGGGCSYYYDTANITSRNSVSVWETWAPWVSAGTTTRNTSIYATYEVPRTNLAPDSIMFFD